MFHIVISVLKVLFRHGEEVVDLIQEIIQEVKGTSDMEKDLQDLEKRTMPPSPEINS